MGMSTKQDVISSSHQYIHNFISHMTYWVHEWWSKWLSLHTNPMSHLPWLCSVDDFVVDFVMQDGYWQSFKPKPKSNINIIKGDKCISPWIKLKFSQINIILGCCVWNYIAVGLIKSPWLIAPPCSIPVSSNGTPITVIILTHWGRVMHICVGKLTIIGSDNGLSPQRRQAIIWTNAGILLIGPLETNFSEILIKIQTFSLKKIRLKMSSAKCSSFRLVLMAIDGDTLSRWVHFVKSLWVHNSNLLARCGALT